ncbi:hypothetical protein BBF96_15175 [Anoxybacter fermentans]|uniref:Spore cortex biosynthesis protein YabQ n=1 Tax=Anoxybacter fermentans TaxID=1323375 RepID=A0A3S9T233_9FIRM|nr:spore cortex biosynthesis protein YabQ [Anoxybacter fermentans]AZR74597.1 hypothetical protein BBF96_15175 [Anoxybacter fermentans]
MLLEIKSFLIMIAGGFAISILYDIYRWLWLAKYQRSWLKHVGDLIFSLLATIIVIGLLLYSNWGELRLYIFFGLGIGIFIYFKITRVIFAYFH